MKLPKLSVASPDQPLGERMLTISPVVLTVLATLLTGLAASEMTKAQYYRATAAQNQAKAGDQWGFFQAKKLRGAGDRNTAELLQATADPAPFDAGEAVATVQDLNASLDRIDAQAQAMLKAGSGADSGASAEQTAARQLMEQYAKDARAIKVRGHNTAGELDALRQDEGERQGLDALRSGAAPRLLDWAPADEKVAAALAAIAAGKDEAETTSVVRQISSDALAGAMASAKDRARLWDEQAEPIAKTTDRVQHAINRYEELGRQVRGTVRAACASPVAGRDADSLHQAESCVHECDAFLSRVHALSTSFAAARLRLEAARYDAEARLNQTIAGLYEIQVRKSSFDSERHKNRSQHFFFGALAAQAAVIGATLALAVKRRSMLWGLAAAVGLAAFGFGAYVYLFV